MKHFLSSRGVVPRTANGHVRKPRVVLGLGNEAARFRAS